MACICDSKYAKRPVEAASKALHGGSDIDLGDSFFSPASLGGNGAMEGALRRRYVKPSDLDVALRRVLTNRFKAGLFDPLEGQIYTEIGAEAVNSTESHDFVLDATLQSLVLLKNDNDVLPLNPGTKLAVVGPHVVSTRDLFEDYDGDEVSL